LLDKYTKFGKKRQAILSIFLKKLKFFTGNGFMLYLRAKSDWFFRGLWYNRYATSFISICKKNKICR